MAEIAAIFHWRPADMVDMPIEDLAAWRNAAVRAWNRMNAVSKPGKG